MDSVKTGGLPCPFCGAGLVRSEEFSNRSRDIFVHELPAAGETDCPARGIILDKSDLAKWNRRAASPAGAEVVAWRDGFKAGIEAAAEAANGVEFELLAGMSERYVSIYCTARRDASDVIRALPDAPCEYCGDGKRTGLPSNACENCMGTGLKYPEFSK